MYTRTKPEPQSDIKPTALLATLVSSSVSAGFPSVASDFVDQKLDLNEHLVKHPTATFFVRVSGTSMINAGIHPGDILIVDRSLEPRNNAVVIAMIEGEFTVKQIQKTGSIIKLLPANPKFKPTIIIPGTEFEVWGVVTHVIHRTTT